MKAIEITGLIKKYGGFVAVNNISLTVEENEIFGLIGPNAAGKTTTLRVLSTLLQPTSGSVKIFGMNNPQNADRIRKIISYLPEDAGAYKNLTGKEYLDFISSFFGESHKRKELVQQGITIADLGDRINDKVDTYSKGMMRRLLVSRALMVNPRLAILDEPTSGLDVINAHEIRQVIQNSVTTDTTVLLSSHNMLEVEFLCDRIALINNGVIVEEGTPQALKKKYGAKNIEDVFTRVVT